METLDKAANSAHESVNKVASAAHQAVEASGEKGKQLNHAEQQLMKYYLSYVRYNPWVSQ
jgi:ElaB/YqjD/DUF883 family membrane-anchored ribosome-binding protein